MKIANSAVAMTAATSFSQSASKKVNLQYWVGDRQPAQTWSSSGHPAVKLDISALSRKLSLQAELDKQKAQAQAAGSAGPADQTDGLSDKDSQTLQMLDEFLYRLTGKHYKFIVADKPTMNQMKQASISVSQGQAAPQRAGWGMTYDSVERYSESATLSFHASGTVQTQDGRTIDFSAALNMSRSYQESSEIHLRAGDAAKVDPLVINLSGAPALSGHDFSFDIDNDGDSDQVAQLLSGSGYLALDKNGDGQINNGGELFGPGSGDGFGELKQYDSDGNGWIDENDPVYDKLRIWMADENGDMQLLALGQQGVGAIYLGSVASPYDIKDTGNNSLGTIQSTGVFLKENGMAGTIQHLDLTV